jgi:hypothetical protein
MKRRREKGVNRKGKRKKGGKKKRNWEVKE